ncbi:hypothetical protein HDU76_011205 [Blyttiomyces sp. JEL0837]|nr:hypothetical protein HDU76_011205 [Blyttiomyces sp. JEL0837]
MGKNKNKNKHKSKQAHGDKQGVGEQGGEQVVEQGVVERGGEQVGEEGGEELTVAGLPFHVTCVGPDSYLVAKPLTWAEVQIVAAGLADSYTEVSFESRSGGRVIWNLENEQPPVDAQVCDAQVDKQTGRLVGAHILLRIVGVAEQQQSEDLVTPNKSYSGLPSKADRHTKSPSLPQPAVGSNTRAAEFMSPLSTQHTTPDTTVVSGDEQDARKPTSIITSSYTRVPRQHTTPETTAVSGEKQDERKPRSNITSSYTGVPSPSPTVAVTTHPPPVANTPDLTRTLEGLGNCMANLATELGKVREEMAGLRTQVEKETVNRRVDMVALRTAITEEIIELRTDIREEIGERIVELRTEVQKEIVGIMEEITRLRRELGQVQRYTKKGFEGLRGDLDTQIRAVRKDISSLYEYATRTAFKEYVERNYGFRLDSSVCSSTLHLKEQAHKTDYDERIATVLNLYQLLPNSQAEDEDERVRLSNQYGHAKELKQSYSVEIDIKAQGLPGPALIPTRIVFWIAEISWSDNLHSDPRTFKFNINNPPQDQTSSSRLVAKLIQLEREVMMLAIKEGDDAIGGASLISRSFAEVEGAKLIAKVLSVCPEAFAYLGRLHQQGREQIK